MNNKSTMSCLFDSLATFVPNTSSPELRSRIIAFLRSDPNMIGDDITFQAIMEWDDDENAEQYLERMQSQDQWGGGIEIRAFCKMYRCRVNVHIPSIGRVVEFFPQDEDDSSGPLFHILWTGNHFVALRSMEARTIPDTRS